VELESLATESKFVRRRFLWLEQYIYKAQKLKQFLHLVVHFGYEVQRFSEEEDFEGGAIEQFFLNCQKFMKFLCQHLQLLKVEKLFSKDDVVELGVYDNNVWESRFLLPEPVKRVARNILLVLENITCGTSIPHQKKNSK
jgi:hypothetical protein